MFTGSYFCNEMESYRYVFWRICIKMLHPDNWVHLPFPWVALQTSNDYTWTVSGRFSNCESVLGGRYHHWLPRLTLFFLLFESSVLIAVTYHWQLHIVSNIAFAHYQQFDWALLLLFYSNLQFEQTMNEPSFGNLWCSILCFIANHLWLAFVITPFFINQLKCLLMHWYFYC